MRALLILLCWLLPMLVVAGLHGPAEVVLNSQKEAIPSLSLSGVNADVFNATAFDNGDLGPSHYVWDKRAVKQNNTPSDAELQNWSNEWVPLPKSFVRN